MTQRVDEVRRAVRDLVWASPAINFLGHDFNDRESRRTDFINAVTRAAMRAVVKQMREFASRRCVSPADQLSIGDAAKVMLDAYAKKAGIDE